MDSLVFHGMQDAGSIGSLFLFFFCFFALCLLKVFGILPDARPNSFYSTPCARAPRARFARASRARSPPRQLTINPAVEQIGLLRGRALRARPLFLFRVLFPFLFLSRHAVMHECSQLGSSKSHLGCDFLGGALRAPPELAEPAQTPVRTLCISIDSHGNQWNSMELVDSREAQC